MLLQAFADHLGGLAKLEIPVLLHFRLQTLHFGFMGVLQALFPDFSRLLFQLDLILQGDDLGILLLDSCLDCKLLFRFRRTGAFLQPENLLILSEQLFLMLCFQISHRLFLDRRAFTANGTDPIFYFLLKQRVANLGNDGGITGLVHLKNLAAIGTFDLVHG